MQTNYKTCYQNTFAKINKIFNITINKMENFAKIDFRTPQQKKREEVRAMVCETYQKAMKAAPDGTSRNRVLSVVAVNLGMTVQGIKNILIRKGLYEVGAVGRPKAAAV